MEGAPILIIEECKLHRDRMKDLRIDVDDILHAARGAQGLARLDQIKYAIAEPNGEITIVAQES